MVSNKKKKEENNIPNSRIRRVASRKIKYLERLLFAWARPGSWKSKLELLFLARSILWFVVCSFYAAFLFFSFDLIILLRRNLNDDYQLFFVDQKSSLE